VRVLQPLDERIHVYLSVFGGSVEFEGVEDGEEEGFVVG
jgi:hypothetical protein